MSDQQYSPEELEKIYNEETEDKDWAYDEDLGSYVNKNRTSPPLQKRFVLASPGKRLFAYIIDSVLINISYGVVSAMLFTVLGENAGGSVGFLFVLAALYGVYIYLPASNGGQTPGKMALGVRIVHETARPITQVDMVLRHLVGYWISSLIFGIGYLWMLWDDENRALHDIIAKTRVVDA